VITHPGTCGSTIGPVIFDSDSAYRLSSGYSMLSRLESNATVGDGHARLGNSVGEFRPAPLLDVSSIVL
jgi:hypothetical protein